MADVVRKVRNARGFTSIEAAKVLNLSQNQYLKKEHGEVGFSLAQAKILSDYFGVTIDELLFSDDVIVELRFLKNVQKNESI